jgi:2-methylisocitrate lyase-like PEP mutase family enzyme
VYVDAVRRIARVVTCPISVDAETGYDREPQRVANNLMQLMDAGAVGFNLEDGIAEPSALCRKIEAVKAAAARAGRSVFINARTDVFLKGLAPGRELDETLRRASLYAAAGADGLFVPNAVAQSDIKALASGQALPLNVMARPGLPSLRELESLGARRLSAGGAIAQAALATAKRLISAFLAEGVTSELFRESLPHAEGNSLLASASPDRTTS